MVHTEAQEQNHPESLRNLIGLLPSFESVFQLDTQEEQARSVVSWIANRSLELNSASYEAVPPDPANCPNCDQPWHSTRSPYCGDVCREQAAFVRQFRSGLLEGALNDPERQVALGQKMWRLLGGGLPLRVGLIPEKAFAKILARNDGRCENCGLPAKHVDHIGTG